jgi:predicted Rossmann fold nucleotide-binding protein DprA/Smf involved in DNA uptake
MILGFTGTRAGMSYAQKTELARLLDEKFRMNLGEFHHGDCLGSDAEAHAIAIEKGWRVVIHPPDKSFARAYCTGAVDTLMPSPFLERNHRIVNLCNVLIATPEYHVEQLRSGTWATIRYARQQQKQIIIINP